jgi:phosphoribosyl-AMP cyclohydrolase
MQGLDQLKYNEEGLIPAIVQDAETGEVLMMAWMNRQSIEDSIKTGRTHFWSRSRKKYWMKGESSGHVQEIQEILTDCDADTLLIRARQHGAACHEGYRNCFFRKLDKDGAWQVCAERLIDPEQVYGKK